MTTDPLAPSASPPLPRTLRVARSADLDGIWPLVEAFATTFTPHEHTFRETFDRLLARDDTLLLVAQDGDEIVGYLLASAHLTFLADGEVVWVEELMVAEGRRLAGTGASLMARAEAWAAGRGAAYVSLASRRAGPFYLAQGYEDSATFYRKICPAPASPAPGPPAPGSAAHASPRRA